LFIFSFKTNVKINHKLSDAIKQSILKNPLSFDEIKKQYRFDGLDLLDAKILKLYFNNDGTKRCLILQESNLVKVCVQHLEFFDDHTKFWTFKFASWVLEEDMQNSVYADLETAIKNETLLKDFHEEKFEIVKKQNIQVEIYWKGFTIFSDEIPFGSYNNFDIQIDGHIIHDVILHNNRWFDFSTSKADMLVIENSFNLKKNFKFNVMSSGKVVGVGKYYKS
jgi:hypothetical protein